MEQQPTETIFTPEDFEENAQISSPASVKARARSGIRLILYVLIFCTLVVTGLVYFYNYLITPPTQFPIDIPITIELGTSVVAIAEQLKLAGVVRSEFVLYAVLVAYYEPRDIKASTYAFSTPLSVYEVAQALTEGNYTYDLVRFTHREGMSVRAMAPDVATTFPHISVEEFITIASPYEGKLFPETYFVPKNITAEELVTLMREAHAEAMQELTETASVPSVSESDIIILASILEREANSPESMAEVANILLRRLSINMPLQVDATMEYVLDRPLSELRPEDLREDSPYNTYTRFGLPPTPIGNPGKEALSAVLNATTATPYLFYITGNDGKFYYARDFDEHRLNIARHLR